MTRSGLAGSLAVFLLATATPAFAAGGDSADAVLQDCNRDGLTLDEVSTCLERARIVDQSDPSARLEALEARLEQRVRNESVNQAPLPPPPDAGQYDEGPSDEDVAPDDQSSPDEASPDYQGPPDEDSGPYDQGASPDDQAPPDAGPPDDGDEPPVDDGEDDYDNGPYGPPPGSYDNPAPDTDQGQPPYDDEDDDPGQ